MVDPSQPTGRPQPGWSADSSSRPPLPRPGQAFGPFVIRGELGRGAMGVVYRAHDPRLGRDVALKVVLEQLDAGRKARFVREGEVTAGLRHAGIVRVHDAGEAGGLPFLAYELVEGARTLDEVFPELSRAERVERVRDAARALGYAHRQGVIHRDVKPDNLLVDAAGNVRVADFGLAAAAHLERLTQTGAVVGTPTHMAPEQFMGSGVGQIGPAADVWGLGVVLYQALTDALPFEAPTLLELGAQISEAAPTPPRELDPSIPRGLEAVCRRALSAEPGERYANGDALADDLDLARSGSRPSAAAVSRVGPALRSRRAAVGLGILLGLAPTVPGVVYLAAARRQAAAEEELAANLRSFERVLLSRPDRERRAALLDEARAAVRASEGSGSALRARLAGRVAFVEGVLAAARGDDAAAAKAAEQVGGQPDRELPLEQTLTGALAAGDTATDPFQAISLLDRGLDAGLRLPELHLLRSRARLRTGDVDQARAALADLEAAERGLGSLGEPDALSRVRALLRVGSEDEARAAAEGLAQLPPDVELAFGLATVESLLPRNPLRAADHLDSLLAGWPPGEPLPLPGTRERIAERAAALLAADERGLVLLDTGATRRALGCLRVGRRVWPDWYPTAGLVSQLLIALNRLDDNQAMVTVSELLTQYYEAQDVVARTLVDDGGREAAEMALPVLERALALAPDSERIYMKVVRARALYNAEDPEGSIAAASECLRDPALEDRIRPSVYKILARAQRKLGQREDALQAVRAGLKVFTRPEPKLRVWEGELLLELERPAEALEVILHYAREGSKETISEQAARVGWMAGLPLGRQEDVRFILERVIDPAVRSQAGWSVRLAWLDLQTGDRAAAVRSAKQAVRAFAKHDNPERRRIGAHLETILPGLATGAPEADAKLKAVVDVLEALRGDRDSP